MNFKNVLAFMVVLNIGLLSTGNLLAHSREEGQHRSNTERPHTQEHKNQGARDAAAMGAAHRSGEQEGYNAGEVQSQPQYIEVPESTPPQGTNTQSPSNSTPSP